MISKKIYAPLFLGALLSCSSSEKAQTPVPPPAQPAPVEKVQPVDPGPTDKQANFFVDKTKDYGLEGVTGTHFYAVDLNNDGYTDLVVLPDNFSVPDFYFFNPELKKFVHDPRGPLPPGLRASFLSFYDFNKDGVRDLLMVTYNQRSAFEPSPPRLFKGTLKDKKYFLNEISNALNLPGLPTSSVVAFDFDLDGKLDLFFSHLVDNTKELRRVVHDRLLRGAKEFSFEDFTRILRGENELNRGQNIYPNARPTTGASICDVDQNGLPDILTSSSSGELNKMWLNLFDAKTGQGFQDFGAQTGFAQDEIGKWEPNAGGSTLFSLCTDYNNNGLIDLFVSELTHSYDAESRDRSSVLTGSTFDFPPQFIRTPYEFDDGRTSWTQAGRRGLFIDFNFDGLIDFVVDNSGFPPDTRLLAFQQFPDHSYQEQSAALGIDILNPSGSVVIDVNRDGRADLITGQVSVRDASIKPRIYVFENQIPRQGRRVMRFYPKGSRSNIHGLGAKLRFTSNQKVQTRFVSYSDGATPSQHEEGIFFGLDKGEIPEKLEVSWPSKDPNGKGLKPTKMTYSLKGFTFSEFVEVSVCESGKLHRGRLAKCAK